MLLASDIRNAFLKFFEKNGHKIIESSPVVPQNDPSLLFTNAGMVQFKNVFTGLETREYKRATTSQKCIRAGGKHNDLDQVGYTARHHTFFEMLGNFSFGDYFKADAINFAWTFLTKELCIPKEKLLVTVYHTDEEAKELWKKVAGDILIIPISTADNFWSMGDVGPCGPCTEIFFDHGAEISGGMPGSPNDSGDRYTEIWNLVFMQFEQKINGERIPLGKKSIDTGMGLERITSVMQGVHDNYQTDLFIQLIADTKRISKTNFDDTYPSYKVIADHIRSIAFLIADGVVPSNEGRGYVLRRILRRAIRHGNMLGVKRPFLFNLTESLVDVMKDAYPELEKARATISALTLNEEEKFLDTLERGLSILNKDIQNLASGDVLSGDIAFKLYDTYGFPLDLTQDILKSKNISVDIKGFDKALEEQRNRAKWIGSGDQKEEKVWHELKERLGQTEFVGYNRESIKEKIIAIVQNGKECSELTSGSAFIITPSTPFYAECGGQCGDTGIIETNDGSQFKVINTLKFCDSIIAHEGEIICGKISVSSDVNMKIDAIRRRKIRANHTATHLLQAALQAVLGKHIAQRGSFLNDERLRFDFSHNSSLSKKDIETVENIVNEWILQGLSVINESMHKNEAISAGAMALFGEKYGEIVRTVKVEALKDNSVVSFELCGGTHVQNTSMIGIFKIISEASIGSGIRRIEAITGTQVIERLRNNESTLNLLGEKLKCSISDVAYKIDDITSELKKKNQELMNIRQKIALEKIKVINKKDISIATLIIDDYDISELRSLGDLIKAKYPNDTLVLMVSGQSSSDKVNLAIMVSSNLQAMYNAGSILKDCINIINGKGGGNTLFAQGAGVGKTYISNIVDKFIELV
ncbi:MAG: alanine--tRNA ligase [Alphaproteobacteria bacterium]|nr:alanine--tRNA ligase [Alphaproteobacteria bacterium]